MNRKGEINHMKRYKRALIICTCAALLSVAPISTMAYSENSLVNSTVTVEEGHEFTLQNAPMISIDLKDPMTGTKMFYVYLKNAKWLDTIEDTQTEAKTGFGVSGATVTLDKLTDEELEVKIVGTVPVGKYYIPLLVKMTGGEAGIRINGNGTEISDMPVPVANASNPTENQNQAQAQNQVSNNTQDKGQDNANTTVNQPLENNDKLMLPIRDVLNTVGVQNKDIRYTKGRIDINYGTSKLTLFINKKTAILNKQDIVLSTEVINKKGKVYIPASDITRLFGIQIDVE